MPSTFHIPARFDASYSLLGRCMRRHLGDERRGEALFIFALAGLALSLIFIHYLVWWLVQPAATMDPEALRYVWAPQGMLWLLVLVTCVAGVKPAITITTTAEGIDVAQGRRRVSVRRRSIRGLSVISALLYHRHYKRYAGTQAFVNRIEPELLLIHLTDGHVVLGLPAAEREAIRRHLATLSRELQVTSSKLQVG